MENFEEYESSYDSRDSYQQQPTETNTIGSEFLQNVRPYIDVIDDLRKCGLEEDINLPNVIVVGDQSSGKSSIIEAISGIQLPRGKGMVTRCPLELQLKRVPNAPWVANLRYKNLQNSIQEIRINRPEEVGKNILQAQNEMCRRSKSVSKELITLRIESPDEDAPDLTLIDLPGITRTPIAGQPPNICDRIEKIIRNHMKNENTVILCIVSANLDAAVNESINVANQYDPNGERTLGIITKPDIAVNSYKEDVLCLLNNKIIPLKKGYHMVKCRSQQELEDNLSLEESIENERIFFKTDRYYKTACKDQVGIPNLSKRITEELVSIIKNNLPNLRERISSALQESQIAYRNLPDAIPTDTQDKLIYLNQLISDLSNEVNMCLEKGKSASITDNMFYEWRQMFEMMREEFSKIKEKALQRHFTVDNLSKQILKERRNELVGFLNFEVFEIIMKEHIVLYEIPAEKLLLNMKKNTEKILNKLINRYFEHLPPIQQDIREIVFDKLAELNIVAVDEIRSIFDKEKLLFTIDQVFERENELLRKEIAAANNANNNPLRRNIEPITQMDWTQKNAERLLMIIDCYLRIIHCRLCDIIPMTIRQCLHIELGKHLKRVLFIYMKTEDVEEKVKENKLIEEKRHHLKSKIKRLQFADSKLSIFSEFS